MFQHHHSSKWPKYELVPNVDPQCKVRYLRTMLCPGPVLKDDCVRMLQGCVLKVCVASLKDVLYKDVHCLL